MIIITSASYFFVLLTSVASNPVMKFRFCPLSDAHCKPTRFASNSPFEFGNITSGVIFYEEEEEKILSVSCTFHEPLHWILTADEEFVVNSISSNVTMYGSRLLYFYHIHFNEATPGLIRCESYKDPHLAAEIYIAHRSPIPTYLYRTDSLLEFLPTLVHRRGGQLIVPCPLTSFNPNFHATDSGHGITLKTLRRTDMIHSDPTSVCLSCFSSSQQDVTHCNTSCAYGISQQIWNDSGRPTSDNETGNQWLDCIRDPKCVKTVMNVLEIETDDCNMDGEITCTDYFSTLSSYPFECEQDASEENFSKIEACVANKFSRLINSTEADFDPRVGFRLKTENDMDAVYVCTSEVSTVYLSPYGPTTKIDARLQLQASGSLKGISCIVPKKSIEDLELDLLYCSTVFECELQLHTYQVRADFRESNGIVDGEPIGKIASKYYGKIIQNPPRTGVVKCRIMLDYDTGYFWDLKYFFTGLDSKSYFTSDSIPMEAIISLKKVQTNLTTSNVVEMEVECTVATFIVFPNFEFVAEYSDGTTRKTEKRFSPHGQWRDGLQEDSYRASQGLKEFVKDGTSIVFVRCRAPFRNSVKQAEAILIMETVVIESDEQMPTENIQSSRADDNYSFPDYLVVILSVGVGLVLLGSVTCAIYGVRKYKKSKDIRQLTLEEINEFLNGNTALATAASNEVDVDGIGFPECFRIPPTELRLHMQEVLGEGQFGRCVSGVYQDLKVAVKTTKASMDVEAFKEFLREVKIMAYLGKHENIVEFLGAVVNQLRSRICLAVIELSPFGDLLSFLRQNDAENPSNVQLFENLSDGKQCEGPGRTKLETRHLSHFCAQIAAAMEFVVGKRMIHGDLAARNVLVFPHHVVKITDFGLSRKLYTASNYKKKSTTPLPWRWMALASLKYMEFSPMTDMWAYGVTAWEIFTMGQVPFAGLVYSLQFVDQIDGGLRLQRPKNAPEEIFQFMKLTWDRIPSARSSFQDAKNFFGNLSAGSHCVTVSSHSNYVQAI